MSENRVWKKLGIVVLAVIGVVSSVSPYRAEAEDIFGGLEGVVILTPENEEPAQPSGEEVINPVGEEMIILDGASDEAGEGLELKLTGSHINVVDDYVVDIVYDVNLMNWDLTKHMIADSVSGKLMYQDEYEFPAVVDFGEKTEIDMLVNLNGTITFRVPYVVAAAADEEVWIEVSVLGEEFEESITLPDEELRKELPVPFRYEDQTGGELEMRLGELAVFDGWNGDYDESYRWIIQRLSLINWSKTDQSLESSLYVLLTYLEKYGFEAQVQLPRKTLGSLETVQGVLAFHVPEIVTRAAGNELGLRITLNEEEWDEEYSLGNAANLSTIEKLALFHPGAEEAISGSDRLLELGGHFYTVFTGQDTWEAAEEYCESLGGHLATISSQEEDKALYEFVTSLGYRDVFFGLSDTAQQDVWAWITGEPFDYVNWYPGEPNSSYHHYGIYWRDFTEGQWGDHGWNEAEMYDGGSAFLCEWDI